MLNGPICEIFDQLANPILSSLERHAEFLPGTLKAVYHTHKRFLVPVAIAYCFCFMDAVIRAERRVSSCKSRSVSCGRTSVQWCPYDEATIE